MIRSKQHILLQSAKYDRFEISSTALNQLNTLIMQSSTFDRNYKSPEINSLNIITTIFGSNILRLSID